MRDGVRERRLTRLVVVGSRSRSGQAAGEQNGPMEELYTFVAGSVLKIVPAENREEGDSLQSTA